MYPISRLLVLVFLCCAFVMTATPASAQYHVVSAGHATGVYATVNYGHAAPQTYVVPTAAHMYAAPMSYGTSIPTYQSLPVSYGYAAQAYHAAPVTYAAPMVYAPTAWSYGLVSY